MTFYARFVGETGVNDPRALSELLAAEKKADALLSAIESQHLVRPGRSEADVGRTYVMGSDPEKHRLCRDPPRIFDVLKRYYDTRPDVTGAELYAYAQGCAEESGWVFGGVIAGHIVGKFPHARIPGDKDLYRISPANPERMRDPDAAGNTRHWTIEVRLVDHSRTFGGFYERLLQPAT
jgi:hypothetical protein